MNIKNVYSAESLNEAITLLKANEGKAKILAGGTDLVGTIREKIHPEPVEDVVSLKALDELK